MRVICRKIKSFTKIGWRKQGLFLEAYILAGVARAMILCLPFKKLKKYMGQHNTQSPQQVEVGVYDKVREVRWAVHQAASYTPWESKCLVKALVAKWMLEQQGIATTLYLGANRTRDKESGKPMQAHAWLRCGEWILTGAAEKSRFVEVARFSNHKK